MSYVYILGIDHFLQDPETRCLTEEGKGSERDQKHQLELLLRQIIENEHIDFVAEEGKLDGMGTGAHLSREFGIEYADITMPWGIREECGVSHDYDSQENTRKIAYRIFEDYMLKVIQERAAHAKGVLVICGCYHIAGLSRSFAEKGELIAVKDIRELGWYKGRPMESNDGTLLGHYAEPR